MENKEKKIWFKRKLYGWGWTPCTWEGWVTILVWLILFIFTTSKMDDHEWLKNLIFILLFTGILILFCFWKGERPRWQWGKRKED